MPEGRAGRRDCSDSKVPATEGRGATSLHPAAELLLLALLKPSSPALCMDREEMMPSKGSATIAHPGPEEDGVVGSCPRWESLIPASNPASIPHSCPCGRGRQEQGMSDGAVRAQRWYLKQRPCCYCCEGCWQIALSRSISMKNEISASCENSAPRGLQELGFLWPLGASRNSMGCTWPKRNPSCSSESSCLPHPGCPLHGDTSCY